MQLIRQEEVSDEVGAEQKRGFFSERGVFSLDSPFNGLLLKSFLGYFPRKFERALRSKLPILLPADFNPEQDYFQIRV